MNSRKSATSVGTTISRLLKSNSFLKSPPPAFYPLLANPTSNSLIKFLPKRPESDLPRSTIKSTQLQQIKLKLNNGKPLTKEEEEILSNANSIRLTRRKPPRPNIKNVRPLPIVFPEDRIREQFFRDHPFEAYRPIVLAENETLGAPPQPNGKAWTQLRQRARIPTAEDAIAFTTSLHEFHSIPLMTAYSTSIAQFRSLRAEQEMATRSARLQAEAHGAKFYGEIQKGINLEEKVLDEWINAREINATIQAAQAERGQSGGIASQINTGRASIFDAAAVVAEEEVAETLVDSYSGGLNLVERFANRNGVESEEGIALDQIDDGSKV